MNETIKVLMRRDDLTYEEAKEMFDETMEEIMNVIECEGTLDDVECVLACNLGLEPDYLLDFLL